jgi:hypothetical protein
VGAGVVVGTGVTEVTAGGGVVEVVGKTVTGEVDGEITTLEVGTVVGGRELVVNVVDAFDLQDSPSNEMLDAAAASTTASLRNSRLLTCLAGAFFVSSVCPVVSRSMRLASA